MLDKKIATALVSFCALAFLASASAAAEYKMGVYPFNSANHIIKSMSPISTGLSRSLGIRVLLRTKSTPEKFFAELENNTYDMIWTHPFAYVRAHDEFGYLPLVRRTRPRIVLVVTNVNSEIQAIEQLKGKSLGMPPSVGAVNPQTRYSLMKRGLHPGRDLSVRIFRNNHDCLQKLVSGGVDACATSPISLRFFKQFRDDQVDVRVLFRSESIPPALISVHPRVPAEHREIITRTMVSWHETEEGRQLLKVTRFSRLVPAKDSDYDVVREMARAMKK